MKKTEVKWCVLLTALIVGIMLLIPSMVTAAEPKGGDVIDAGNVDQYKDYLPMYMQRFIKDGWGQWEPVVLHVDEKKPATGWTKEFAEASKKNKETCKLRDDDLIEGYNGQGAPFMDPEDPKKATKIMWNSYYKIYPDDWMTPDNYLSMGQRKGGRVTFADTKYEQIMMSNRTMREPIPELVPNPDKLYYANKGNSRTPPSKDMATLTWRYQDTTLYDDMWMYVPTLRRTIRLVSSERSNPIQGTPLTYDDIFGFDGKIPFFTYELVGEQTVLSLLNQKFDPYKDVEDRNTYPFHPVLHYNEKFGLIDCYVIEIKSKDPRYPYSVKTVWVDKVRFWVMYSQIYDKNGEFWKAFWNGAQTRIVKTTHGEEPLAIQSSSGIIDFKTGNYYGSRTAWLDMNCGVEKEYFRPETLSASTW